MHQEQQYLDLLERLINHGEERIGRNGKTFSIFGEHLSFCVRTGGFPLLTTKNVFWRGIVEELLWFLKGDTNANNLMEKGVNIWKDNSTREFLDQRGLHEYPEGECGPIYGYQWRCFNGEFPNRNKGIDQLRYIITELRNNPSSRRAIMTAWNPCQLDAMCLPPCHVLYNFHLSPTNGLSCQMYQRSCDTCAGLPFNIASTALLTRIIAETLGVQVDKIVISIGDAHIYEEHVYNAKVQVSRVPYDFPTLNINTPAPGKTGSVDDNLHWIENLTYNDFELVNRTSHPAIKYKMIA